MRTPADAPILAVDLGRGVVAGFTTRAGGVSPAPWDSLDLGLHVGDDAARVRVNRARVENLLGVPVAWSTQVHGTSVGRGEDGLGRDTVGEHDALVTGAGGVGVLVADCVPVLLADPEAGLVAVAHAGRRGLEDGVVGAAVAALVDRGGECARVRAAVGPCACPRCYEVPAAMRAATCARVPGTAATTSWGTPSLDLRAGVEASLRAAGATHVVHVDLCTIEDERFFSHRRATRTDPGALTGRCAGVVGLTTDTPRGVAGAPDPAR